MGCIFGVPWFKQRLTLGIQSRLKIGAVPRPYARPCFLPDKLPLPAKDIIDTCPVPPLHFVTSHSRLSRVSRYLCAKNKAPNGEAVWIYRKGRAWWQARILPPSWAQDTDTGCENRTGKAKLLKLKGMYYAYQDLACSRLQESSAVQSGGKKWCEIRAGLGGREANRLLLWLLLPVFFPPYHHSLPRSRASYFRLVYFSGFPRRLKIRSAHSLWPSLFQAFRQQSAKFTITITILVYSWRLKISK